MKKSILSLLLLINLANADYIRDDDRGIVIDTTTSLMWQDEPYTSAEVTAFDNNTESGKVLYWTTAISYCENLTYGTYSDWYLPNYNELKSIVDRNNYNPSLNSIFTNSVSSVYWSSTSVAYDASYAWVVYFDDGGDYAGDKTRTGYVRCVRSADN